MKRSLVTGVAYHGNRMLSHVRADMAEIAGADMDLVVHMFSHNDWERHKSVMKEILAITRDAGLASWVDNWGLAGEPGDRSHFLAYHPEERMIGQGGVPHPFLACFNSPVFRQFVKDWTYTVREIGGETVFWDEPMFRPVVLSETDKRYVCCCARCQTKFEERFHHPMPNEATDEVVAFRMETLLDFFREVTEYSHSLGMGNALCCETSIPPETVASLCTLPYVDSMGADPYWYGDPAVKAYPFVYEGASRLLRQTEAAGIDHNLWIQSYNAPRGREEEIVEACTAAYDAGARTLIAWGYRGSEANDYRSENPERAWLCTVEGMRLVRWEERRRIWEENRKNVKKN